VQHDAKKMLMAVMVAKVQKVVVFYKNISTWQLYFRLRWHR